MQGVYPVYHRGRVTPDFILSEEESPNGRTRKEVIITASSEAFADDLKIGSLVDAKCKPVKFKAVSEVVSSAIAGISLCEMLKGVGATKYYHDLALVYIMKCSDAKCAIELKDTFIEDAVMGAIDSTLIDALNKATTTAAKDTASKAIDAVGDAIEKLIHAEWSIVPCGK